MFFVRNEKNEKLFTVVLIIAVAVLIAAEAAYRWAERSVAGLAEVGSCAVLVLGYPSRADGQAHRVQRFRTRVGVELVERFDCERIVFSGAAVRNAHPEAEAMAALARAAGVAEARIVVEGRARSTWENIACAGPYVAEAERVLLVSDSLHARRGQRYACRQDAALCERLVLAGRNPPVSQLAWKPLTAAHEGYAFLRDKLIYERRPDSGAATCP
ncbi:hypothetical protein CAI21_18230 [Alkalilimnicola ehrlichii]|uniref:DUF218 domain-containing protein n=1 Tax=Alkalilimnicola ehrlichii TaxID=351052 RepID=A0A3E0WSD5_9GAMM|nr:YdcF family protein [Alkalilimnicola ehrlichii]RFA25795.1 hypothetical protein CAI21_18230 [Alkalilimnicola ehrlichii]RFA35103.1 hypothetical protein CAL65_13410 [Alkalilimnicola ehrlichii]